MHRYLTVFTAVLVLLLAGCDKDAYLPSQLCKNRKGFVCVMYEVGGCEVGRRTLDQVLDSKIQELSTINIHLKDGLIIQDKRHIACLACTCPSGIKIFGNIIEKSLNQILDQGFKPI